MLFSVARLIRIEKSLLSAISVFLPAYLKTNDLGLSLSYSIPVFTIIAVGFIINDVNDIERDQVNNPERVLPQKLVTLNFAVFLYFFLLLITLIVVKVFIPFNHIFSFLLFVTLVTNYNYVVSAFPYLKNLYVVLITGVHLSIMFLLIPFNPYFFVCTCLNILSQEMLLDLRDLNGDGSTFPKIVGKRMVIQIVMILQILQLLVLLINCKYEMQYWGLILFIILVQTLGYIFWKKEHLSYTINTLKVQIMVMFVLIL